MPHAARVPSSFFASCLVGFLFFACTGCDELKLPDEPSAAPEVTEKPAEDFEPENKEPKWSDGEDSEDGQEYEREVAKVGYGKQGRKYGGGIITEPVSQYFKQRDRLELIKIQSAMNLYKGEHGYFPKTQEEFMAKIIKPNSISLPELPEGQRYAYDAKSGQLMVEKPK